ncbi:MAG: molybdopterin-dependent oxidoreductase [Dehalococcoidia bacterium]
MKESRVISRRSLLKATAAATALGVTGTWMLRPKGDRLVAQAQDLTDVQPVEETWKPTTCWVGKQDCGILARIENGRIVKLEGHPDNPRNQGKLCPKGIAQIMAVYDPYRVKKPLRRINGKGESGEWKEITWEEALDEVGRNVRDVIDRDPDLLLWQKGRSKAKVFYDSAFVDATGALKMGHGAFCSDAGYRALEYTTGLHGVLHPDFRYTNYMLSWGWEATRAGGNKTCWLTWPRQFLEARERGMKVVTIDPRKAGMGPHTDEWLPIKPGSDLTFLLALANVLIEKGHVDSDYLTNFTNAPFLVQESEGRFYRVGDKEQVWDTASQSAKAADAEGIKPALDGEYIVGNAKVKTAYRLLKEHVSSATPEWAAEICGLSADSIRKVAEELGEKAMIGSTIVVDGEEVPYRPVSMMGYHVTQQELGFQACRAAVIVFMLLGAVEAAGGIRTDWYWKDHKNYAGLDAITIKDTPDNLYLKNSKFFPINSANPGIAAKVMLDPDKYDFPKDKIPEVCIVHMANPLCSFLDTPTFKEAYQKFKFVCVIDPWLSETADFFADIVLPAATMEKYEGAISANTQYHDATTLRLPPIDPLFDSRGDIDIYLDLCERIGPDILAAYIDSVNKNLKLKDTANEIPNNTKPAVRDIFDRWAKEHVDPEGIAYFEKHGVYDKGAYSASKYYGRAQATPFEAKDSKNKSAGYDWIRGRLYGESLLGYQREMKAKGADKIYYQDYTPFPVWRMPTMHLSPSAYDLTLISYKKIEFKQSRSTFFPILAEMAPRQRLDMNPQAAKARGINDDDEILVESHNAITGETRRVKAKACYTEAIRPDTVAMSHHYGMWTHPWSKGHGATPNELFFTGEGYVTNTADQSFHVKVSVVKV